MLRCAPPRSSTNGKMWAIIVVFGQFVKLNVNIVVCVTFAIKAVLTALKCCK
jgi:hypothetical protein